MVSFEIFVKAMPPSLSELKVLTSFCFPIKIRNDRTASNKDGPLMKNTEKNKEIMSTALWQNIVGSKISLIGNTKMLNV